MAGWLGLDVVGATGRGTLAKDLVVAGAEFVDDGASGEDG